jgi:hypothetical protein
VKPLEQPPTLKRTMYPIGGVKYLPFWNPQKLRYDLQESVDAKPFAYIKLEVDGSEKIIKIK